MRLSAHLVSQKIIVFAILSTIFALISISTLPKASVYNQIIATGTPATSEPGSSPDSPLEIDATTASPTTIDAQLFENPDFNNDSAIFLKINNSSNVCRLSTDSGENISYVDYQDDQDFNVGIAEDLFSEEKGYDYLHEYSGSRYILLTTWQTSSIFDINVECDMPLGSTKLNPIQLNSANEFSYADTSWNIPVSYWDEHTLYFTAESAPGAGEVTFQPSFTENFYLEICTYDTNSDYEFATDCYYNEYNETSGTIADILITESGRNYFELTTYSDSYQSLDQFSISTSLPSLAVASSPSNPYTLNLANLHQASIDGSSYTSLPDPPGYFGYFQGVLGTGECQAEFDTDNWVQLQDTFPDLNISYYFFNLFSDAAFSNQAYEQTFSPTSSQGPATFNFEVTEAGLYFLKFGGIQPIDNYTVSLSGACIDNAASSNIRLAQSLPATYPSDTTQATATIDSTGEDALLVVNVAFRSTTGAEITDITAGGQPLVKGCRAHAHEYPNETWYLANPPVNVSLPITVNFSNITSDGVITPTIFTGVDQTNPVSNSSCWDTDDEGDWNLTPNVTINATTGQVVMGGFTAYSAGGQTITPDSTQTEIWNFGYAGNVATSGSYYMADFPDNISLNWTVNNNTPWSASAIAINPTSTEAPVNDGTAIDRPIEITKDNSTYNFLDNSDGNYTYAVVNTTNATGSARLIVETYDVGSGESVDTLLEYFGEDSTFTTKLVENDDFFGQYSRYYFNSEVQKKYYFRISDKLGSSENFGLRYLEPSNLDPTAPDLELSNFSIEPTQVNQPTWTGRTIDAQSVISSVAISISNIYNETEVPWTETTPLDGAWDELEEEFTFTSPIPLEDGLKNILVRAIDVNNSVTDRGDFGGYTTYFYAADRIIVDAIDTEAPIIQIYDVVPDPISDLQPKIQGKVEDYDDNQRFLTSDIAQIYYSLDSSAWVPVNSLDGTYDDTVEAFSIQMPILETGEHTVRIRAVDTVGNDTNNVSPTQNKSVSFSVVEPNPNLTATILEKNETFIDQEDLDFISGENYIWGNGILRLSETFNPEILPLVTGSEFGHRYVDDYYISPDVTPSADGGSWMTKGYGDFSYYEHSSQQEYDFNIGDYGLPIHPFRIQEVKTASGEYHLWITADHYLLIINFGTSITDGQSDQWITEYFSYPTGVFEIDTREDNYGAYISSDDGLYYFQLISFSDSQLNPITRHEPTPGTNGDWLDNITSIYLEEENNRLWIGEYSEGLRLLDDKGTPHILTGDDVHDYTDYVGIFDIGVDKNNFIYFAGDQGLFQFTDWGGSEWGDESIINILSTDSTGNNPISQVSYLPGEYPVGSQFFIGTRTGDIFYLSTNDTPANNADDQVLSFSATGGQYPAETFGMYSLDYDTLVVAIRRMGIYQINLNRDFALSGYAESQTDARIEGRLDVDFITLDNVNVLVEAGGVSYQVSNDGGENWHNISPGETINFPEHDYRIKFRINMTHGSTPVIGGYDLSYASYPTPEERGSYIRVADEPDRVTPGESLTFKVESFDDLNNPVEGNVSAQLELRQADTNEAVDFEVDDATIINGSVTIITTAPLEVGDYRIYVWNEDSSDYSDVITVDYPPVDPPDDHDENGDQDDDGDADDGQTDGDSDDDDDDDDKSTQKKYNPSISLKSSVDGLSEPESVLISWESKYVDVVELKSQYMNYGVVELDGARNIYVDKDTTFWVTGGGPRGSVKAEVRIAWLGDTSPSTGDPGSGGDSQTDQPPVISSEDINSTEPPTIENFTVTPDPDEPTKIVVDWRVDDADFVEISPIGGPLAAEGSKEIFITEPKTTFVLTARNEAGEVKEERLIEIDQSDLDERLAFLKNVEANLANEKNQFGSWWKGDFTKAISALLILLLVSFWLAWLVRRRKSKKEQINKLPKNPIQFN